MKIQLVSDLHLELNNVNDYNDIISISAPILCLGGDIGNPMQENYIGLLDWCHENYEKVFIITGNHEYYTKDMSIEDINKKIENIADKYDNIYFLNNSHHVLSDEYVILGTTLWSYIKKDEEELVALLMNDFNKILDLNIKEYNKLHFKCYFWLNNEIKKYNHLFGKKMIILTHHLPSFQVINEKYKNSCINSGFASDLELLIKKENVKYWFFGHSHTSCDTVISDCQLISNPYGYHNENNKYKKDMVINIKI